MAQQNFVKLASQGRSYDETRAWSEVELEALLTLERDCGVDRKVAALYVRNGITTKAVYETAKKAGFVPKSLEDLRAEAIAEHQKVVLANLGVTEEVIEPTVVEETEEVVSTETTPEEVIEPTEVEEPEVIADPKKSKSKGGK